MPTSPLIPKIAELMRSSGVWASAEQVETWTPGELHSFPGRRGVTACVFYTDCPGEGVTGYFGEFDAKGWVFRESFLIEGENPAEAEARAAAAARMAARKKEEDERLERAGEAAAKAEALYAIGRPADGSNAYLSRKRVYPLGLVEVGLEEARRVLGYAPKRADDPLAGPLLVVPLFDAEGTLVNAEMIDPNGVKVAIAGGPRSGVFWSTSQLDGADIIGLAEGMATAQTLHDCLHIPLVSVGGCGNFKAVLAALKARIPKAKFIVFGDLGNGGEIAKMAAREHEALFCGPPDDMLGTDFNDLMIEVGDAAVREAALPAIDAAREKIDGLEVGEGSMLFHPRCALVAPDIDFVLPGFMAGSVGLLVGEGSVGKSFLAMQIALSLALGERLPWGMDDEGADRLKIGKAGVLLGEDEVRIIQLRYHSVFNAYPQFKDEEHLALMERNLRVYGLPGVDMRIIEESRGEIAIGKFLSKLEAFCEGKRLVFIDPLGKLLDGNENDNRIAARMMERLVLIGRNTGCSPIILHHVAKGGSDGRESWTAARGASAITNTARFQMNMNLIPPDECIKLGITEDERHRYVRLAVAKVNYGDRMAPVMMRRGPGGVLLPFGVPESNRNASFDAVMGSPTKKAAKQPPAPVEKPQRFRERDD